MKDVAREIETTVVEPGSVALWWLAQAGFVFKTAGGTVLYLDAYLSDLVEKNYGMKRLSLAPIEADDVRADWFISSHEHEDHLDTDALPAIAANNPGCRFAGSVSCEQGYDKRGIPASRRLIMEPGKTYDLDGVTLHTARADHGEQVPHALAFLFDFGGVTTDCSSRLQTATRVMFSGDTALTMDWLQPLIDLRPDVLLPCINGRFGNLDANDAARLTAAAHPKLVIPCHFWMFKEHNGDPEAFVQACAKMCPEVEVRLLSPGEQMMVNG